MITSSSLPDHAYVNAFNLIPGVGAQKLTALGDHFATYADAWHAPKNDLIRAGLSEKLSAAIDCMRVKIDPHAQWALLQNHSITLLLRGDAAFPLALQKISHPPFCLYVRGDSSLLSAPSVAIVGSRKISDYGVRATQHFVRDLTQAHITIISGLALGTDACAHRATVAHNGRTIAFLAGGVDDPSIAPHSHLSLAHKIVETGGALVSEYPVGTTPGRGTFPARNRLMAGLANATVIIEATMDSGTLITAQHARDYNKPLFALPGSLFSPLTAGPHMLIRQHAATPLLDSTDLLSALHITPPTTQKKDHPEITDPTHKIVYDMIAQHDNGIHINILMKNTRLDITTISTTLTMLEIERVIKNIGNQTYVVDA